MHLTSTIVVAVVTGAANAHMLLNNPKRFPSITDNGPLVGQGASNYPCKATSGSGSFYDFDFARTQLPVGQNYTMNFTGSAVHGGGSCQLSLTKDLQPTKDSVFKVIHSIIGGCPARNTKGNLEGGPELGDPNNYDFEVPAGIEPGKYTFAWTWFNHVGNREMYMNCAPVEITGGSSKAKRDPGFFDSLPNIFLANIPDVECTTDNSGGEDGQQNKKSPECTIEFPEPGKSVERNAVMADPTSPVPPPHGLCYAPPGGGASSGSQKSGSSTQDSQTDGGASAAAADSGAATSSLSVSPAYTPPSEPNMNQIAPYPQSNSSTASISAPAPSDSSTAGSGSGSSDSDSTSSGSCPSTAVPCSTPGSIVCVGSNQFGLCDINNCAIVQAVAAGTTCSNGAISKRSNIAVPRLSHRRRGAHPHFRSHRYVPHQ